MPLLDFNLSKHFLTSDYKHVLYIARTLQAASFSCYIVGGSIRDIFLEAKSDDIDFSTDATPNQIQKIFPKTIASGLKYGTVTILHEEKNYEITTFRRDMEYFPNNRYPKKILFTKSLKEDLERRDFTINALAYNPLTYQLIYYCPSGLEDIKYKLLRAIGQPLERFREDPLRVIRACRLAAKFKFSIVEDTWQAMRNVEIQKKVAQLTKERVIQEFRKGLNFTMIELMLQIDVLKIFFPSLLSNPHKSSINWETLFKQMQHMCCGYLSCISYLYFFCNSDIKLLQQDAKNLNFSKNEIKLLQNFYYYFILINKLNKNQKQFFIIRSFLSSLKKSLNESQQEKFFSQLHDNNKQSITLTRLKKHLMKDPLLVTDLAINGHDLLNWHIPSQEIGKILQDVLQVILHNPQMNNRQEIQQYIKSQILIKDQKKS